MAAESARERKRVLESGKGRVGRTHGPLAAEGRRAAEVACLKLLEAVLPWVSLREERTEWCYFLRRIVVPSPRANRHGLGDKGKRGRWCECHSHQGCHISGRSQCERCCIAAPLPDVAGGRRDRQQRRGSTWQAAGGSPASRRSSPLTFEPCPRRVQRQIELEAPRPECPLQRRNGLFELGLLPRPALVVLLLPPPTAIAGVRALRT